MHGGAAEAKDRRTYAGVAQGYGSHRPASDARRSNLTESIAHPPNGKVSLIVSNFDTVQTREILYAGGVRNPHLEPIPGRHDYLSEILASRAPAKH